MLLHLLEQEGELWYIQQLRAALPMGPLSLWSNSSTQPTCFAVAKTIPLLLC